MPGGHPSPVHVEQGTELTSMRVMLSVGGVLLGPAPLHPARTRGTISACTTSRVMRPSAHLKMVRLTLWISCEARLSEANRRGHLPLAPRLLHPLVGRPRQSTRNDSEEPSTTSHRRLREDTAATLIRTTQHGGIVRPFSSRSKDLLARARAAPATARRWGVGSPGRQSGSRAPQQRWSFNPARDAQPKGAQRGRAT
jgi:hypothetical protein